MLVNQPGKVGPHIELLGNAEIPVYLVRGEKWSLVDTGVMIVAPHVVDQLDAMPGAREKITYIALTHSHFDHVGALPALKRAFPNAEIVAGEVTAEVFRKPKAVSYIRSINESFVKILNMEKQYPGFDFSIPDLIDVDRTVKEGEIIDLGGGVTLEVYEVPGHSRCSIAFFLKPDNALFAGESAGFYNGPGDVISEGLSDYSAYMKGLDKMNNLKPEIICLPHNGVLTGEDAAGYFDIAIRDGGEFRGELEKRLNAGQADEKILEEITLEKYKGPITHQPREVFLGNLRAMINAVRREIKG